MTAHPRPRRARTAVAAVALAATALTACSSGSAPSPPAGVDGLTIPTPDPRADDFVEEVDHPWLRLEDGTFREFEDGSFLVVTTGPERDGIATVAVSLRPGLDVAPDDVVHDFMAQDRDGNVWWFGRQVGVGSSATWFDEPGLLLPATPRRGDGWVAAAAPGLDVRARIVDDAESVEVPAGEYDDAIVLEVVEDGLTRRETYVRGVGLVRRDEAGLVTE